MNCAEVRESLSPWLDGELSPEVRTLVDRHLASCDACLRELAQLEALERALAALPVPPLPEGLPERVAARLPRPSRHWWQSMALAASLILGIVLGGALARDFYPVSQESGYGTEVASLDAFHDFPQGSMGLILASYQEDEGIGNAK